MYSNQIAASHPLNTQALESCNQPRMIVIFQVTSSKFSQGRKHLQNLQKQRATVAVQKGEVTWDGLDMDRCKVSKI